MKIRWLAFVAAGFLTTSFVWGFFGHRKIAYLAVFTLPSEMVGFYKKNIHDITEMSVNPDRRRYAVSEEATRHYIDTEDYGDSALYKLPRYWNKAIETIPEDTLNARGIVPWHISKMYFILRDAMMVRDPQKIIQYSAELSHYIADAQVPLHTTRNYDGQMTGQKGIHACWESRLPELFFNDYDFFVGKADYIQNIQLAAWAAVITANNALDSVLQMEHDVSVEMGEKKYAFESKGSQTVKVYSVEFSKVYHERMAGMVERQMRASVKMTGDVWYTAWVDAGQPDLTELINYKPTEQEISKRKEELKQWKELQLRSREHETENN